MLRPNDITGSTLETPQEVHAPMMSLKQPSRKAHGDAIGSTYLSYHHRKCDLWGTTSYDIRRNAGSAPEST